VPVEVELDAAQVHGLAALRLEVARDAEGEGGATVADVMSTDPLVVAPEDTLGEVAEKMRAADIGSALVADYGRLIGILTSRDLLRAFAGRVHPSEARVREWMTAEPVAVSAATPIEAAVTLMTEYGFHHLPVIDEERPTGMLGLRQAARQARWRIGIGLGFGRVPAGDRGCCSQLVRVQPNRSSASRGRPPRIPRQRTAAFSTRGLRESASTAAVALSPSKKKTTSRSLTKTWCRSSPKISTSKGGTYSTSRRGRLGRAPRDRNNDGNARPRRPLGPEPSEQIGELAEQAHPAQGGDKHSLAGVSLEDERLVAVDPFSRSAPDLDGRELIERDPEPIGFTRPVQDEVVVAEFEPAAGGRAGASAPDNGVLVRTAANTLGGHDCSFPLGEAIAPTPLRGVRERCSLCAAKY
jgi:CBS domain-containing protein